MNTFDVIVVGGGQSGLAVGYYLRRSGLSFVILDQESKPGGAWIHAWESIRLFSPAQWSSLPGFIMPGGADYYPTRSEVIDYLSTYERRYDLPVKRPISVQEIRKEAGGFILTTTDGTYHARAVVSATGSFYHPYIPDIPGSNTFRGRVLHSSEYRAPNVFEGKSVAIVGEGNSGAQLIAELSLVASVVWITRNPPRFLPDHIDGRYLFDAATKMYEAKLAGKSYEPPSLSDIVMVPSVKEARKRGVLHSLPPFHHYSESGIVWENGDQRTVDTIIFCTGFKPVLAHLHSMSFSNHEKPATEETRSLDIEGLWLVGYGNWTGFASATLIGVGRSARKTVEEVKTYIDRTKHSSTILSDRI